MYILLLTYITYITYITILLTSITICYVKVETLIIKVIFFRQESRGYLILIVMYSCNKLPFIVLKNVLINVSMFK